LPVYAPEDVANKTELNPDVAAVDPDVPVPPAPTVT
jgi:hypothetical protein